MGVNTSPPERFAEKIQRAQLRSLRANDMARRTRRVRRRSLWDSLLAYIVLIAVFHATNLPQSRLEPLLKERAEEIANWGTKARMGATAGIPDFSPEIHRISRWTMEGVLANQFQSGRVLLLGDAVHKTSFEQEEFDQPSHLRACRSSRCLSGETLPAGYD